MEIDDKRNQVAERLEAATSLLERTLELARRAARRMTRRGGEDLGNRGAEPRAKRSLQKSSRPPSAKSPSSKPRCSAAGSNPLRKTVPAATSEMLAKHGIADGPVDVRTLDAALRAEPGAAHRGQEPVAARRRHRVNAASSYSASS